MKTAKKKVAQERSLEAGPVLVLGNGEKPEVTRALEQTRERLERDFGIAAVDLDKSHDLSKVDAKWVLLFGGDGALLAASRRMGTRQLPTLAVNFGRLGFLTEVEYRFLDQALDHIASGKVHVRERVRLTARMGNWTYDALNDVVVHAPARGKLFRVSAKIGPHEALRYAGDGVIIATPTGSTAYSMAGGGPILDPELEAIVITPLAAHTLSQRPLVIPTSERIELYLREGDPPGRVTLDGQVSHEFGGKDRLKVSRAETSFLLIRVGLRSHYLRLRRILGWGGQPKYSG